MRSDPNTVRPREMWTERCDRCRRWTPRIELRFQNQTITTPRGENILPWTHYNASGWSCTGSDQALYSQSDSDYYLDISPQTYPTADTTNRHGTQTWGGDGRYSAAAALDWSADSSVVIETMVGFSHEQDDPGGTFVVGIRSGGVDHVLRTVTVLGDRWVWGTIATADLTDSADCTPYFEMTCDTADALWWVDWHQGFSDVTSPPKPRTMTETFGAVADNSKTSGDVVLKVCPDCLEEHRDDFNEAEPGVAEPPDVADMIEEE